MFINKKRMIEPSHHPIATRMEKFPERRKRTPQRTRNIYKMTAKTVEAVVAVKATEVDEAK